MHPSVVAINSTSFGPNNSHGHSQSGVNVMQLSPTTSPVSQHITTTHI